MGDIMGLCSQTMNLDYIRTFVVLGQSRNMTEASKKLNIDVSNVSRHIKMLEKELKVKLIMTGTKNRDLQLTDIGRYFFTKYEKVYNEILLTEKEYRQSISLDDCKISIGISSNLEPILLKSRLFAFREKYPSICIKIINGEAEDLVKQLSQYTLDFIIIVGEVESFKKKTDIVVKQLFKSNYCLAYNKKYFDNQIDLTKYPFIIPNSSTYERFLIDEYLKTKNIGTTINYEIENDKHRVDYIKEGLGVGILLKEEALDCKDLSYIDLDIECQTSLLYLKENLTSSTKEFLKMFTITF